MSEAPYRIAIAVFDGAEELDFVGPWEVMGGWHLLYPDDLEVFLVGEDALPVTCAKGMRVLADRTWDELGEIDVLIYPGGRGTRPQLGDERIRARIRGLRDRGTLMTGGRPPPTGAPSTTSSNSAPTSPRGPTTGSWTRAT
jgi:putative intracellular protease/amidase